MRSFCNFQLLHSLDEDDRSVLESPVLSRKDKEKEAGVQHSPIKSATAPTSPIPVSASPVTNAKFISTRTGHNGKLKTSPINVGSLTRIEYARAIRQVRTVLKKKKYNKRFYNLCKAYSSVYVLRRYALIQVNSHWYDFGKGIIFWNTSKVRPDD